MARTRIKVRKLNDLLVQKTLANLHTGGSNTDGFNASGPNAGGPHASGPNTSGLKNCEGLIPVAWLCLEAKNLVNMNNDASLYNLTSCDTPKRNKNVGIAAGAVDYCFNKK